MIHIQKELTDLGLTEEILLFFHSRTANSEKEIEKAYVDRYSWRQSGITKAQPGDPLRFKVAFKQQIGVAEYTLEVAKVRQKRLNLLLMKTKSSQ